MLIYFLRSKCFHVWMSIEYWFLYVNSHLLSTISHFRLYTKVLRFFFIYMRMPRRYLIATATTCICTEIASINGFVNNTPPSRNNRIESAAAAEKEDRQQWNHEPFDFSRKLGWDTFYEDGIQATTNDEDIKDTTTEKLEYDWHPHISHSIIVDCIKPTIETASEYYQSTLQNKRMAPSCW